MNFFNSTVENFKKLNEPNQGYIDSLIRGMLVAQDSIKEQTRKREEQLRRELSRPMTLK